MSTSPDTPVTEMDRDELEEEIESLRRQVSAMEARFDALSTKFDALVTVCLGDPHELGSVEPEEMTDLLTRTKELDDRVTEHDARMEMFYSESGGRDDPDGRAMRLRQTLYNTAKNNDGTAALDRDGAEGALNGGLHKASVLDAMKRAADGRNAKIDGSSDLDPVASITFCVGEGRGNQSRIEMDLSDATGAEVRQNLTTGQTEEGGR